MTPWWWRFDGRRRRTTRLAGLGAVAALLVTVGLVAGWQPPAKAASHPLLSGLKLVSVETRSDLSPTKTATAPCPSGKRVLGGGGEIRFGGTEADGRLPVTLTRMEPYQLGWNPDDPQGYGYRVDAAALTAGPSAAWALHAWAFCANASSVPGIHIVVYSSSWSSAPVQATTAPCPDGQHVLGTGAGVVTSGPSVRGLGLQVARADGLGLLARAQAHAQPDGLPLRLDAPGLRRLHPQHPAWLPGARRRVAAARLGERQGRRRQLPTRLRQ